MSRTKKILAIDGGGFRGAYSAYTLKRMEEEYAINWIETFDLIAGTSTGAIIAAGLASGSSAKEMFNFYEEYGSQIFKKRWFYRTGLFASRYKNKKLQQKIKNIFGDKKLGEIQIPLIIPATDIGNGCVHVFKSSYHGDFVRDKNILIADAVLASCGAPTYFDPYKVEEYILADGGLWANNPSLVAVIDAKRRLAIDLNKVKVFSLGSGSSLKSYSQKDYWWKNLFGWGILTRWGRAKFIDMLMNLQTQTANNMLGLLLQPEQILRINFGSDRDLSLDDPKKLKDWITKAGHDFTHNSTQICNFLDINKNF